LVPLQWVFDNSESGNSSALLISRSSVRPDHVLAGYSEMLLATGGLSSFGMAQALDPSVQLLLLQQQVPFLSLLF
jgi:hypothetical protein